MATQQRSVWAMIRGFFRVIWRAARQLFHEAAGALFILIALSALQSTWRVWRNGASHWLIELTAGYALLMIFFGVLSFRDARRVQ